MGFKSHGMHFLTTSCMLSDKNKWIEQNWAEFTYKTGPVKNAY